MKKLIIIVLSILFFSCSSPRVVRTERADNITWSNYRTFDFYNVEATGDTIASLFTSRIGLLKQSISDKLQKNGLRQSATNPDLLVNIGLVVNEQVQKRQTTFPSDAPRYVGQRRYSWRSQEVVVDKYRQGTVTLDIVDSKQNMLVWKGVVEGVVPEKEEKVQRAIEEGITKLFQGFPTSIQ